MMPVGVSLAGYVLAGGRSARMGRDKALLELGGRPLVEQALSKLRSLTDDVKILSGRRELKVFAPLVADLHEGCGPLGGLEAALGETQKDWIVVHPIDMPFLPAALLRQLILEVLSQPCARIAGFAVEGRTETLPCVLHRAVAPWVIDSVKGGKLKMIDVLEEAARGLAAAQHVPSSEVFFKKIWTYDFVGLENSVTKAQSDARRLWFANLNTPEQFAEAERHADALDVYL